MQLPKELCWMGQMGPHHAFLNEKGPSFWTHMKTAKTDMKRMPTSLLYIVGSSSKHLEAFPHFLIAFIRVPRMVQPSKSLRCNHLASSDPCICSLPWLDLDWSFFVSRRARGAQTFCWTPIPFSNIDYNSLWSTISCGYSITLNYAVSEASQGLQWGQMTGLVKIRA